MGLESFTTEGPRSYKKSTSSTIQTTINCIHIVGGMDDRQFDFLKRHEVHYAFRTPEAMNLELPSGGPYMICSECGKVASDYPTMLKTDLLDFTDKEWHLDAKEKLISEFKETPTDEYYRGGLEDVELDNNESESVGSSSDDKDFKSGLDSFLS